MRSIPRASWLLALLALVSGIAVHGQTSRTAHVRVFVRRSAEVQRRLDSLAAAQNDPGSPEYHHWRTAAQIRNEFGPSEAAFRRVRAFAAARGLRVDHVANSGLFLTVSGDADVLRSTFVSRIEFSGGREPVAGTLVPPDISGDVFAVRTKVPRPLVAGTRVRSSYTSCYSNGDCYHYLAPADFATIYDLNPVYQGGDTGQGQTIGVISRSRVYAGDVTSFESETGLAQTVPAVLVPPDGVDPGAPSDSTADPPSSDQINATVGVQRTLSTATGATTELIVSADTDTEDGTDIALSYAIDKQSSVGANILAVSDVVCEASVSASQVAAWDALFQQASVEGISVVVASGDAGAAGCDTPGTTPPEVQLKSANALCASSYVTCVGGTDFSDTTSPSTYWSNSNSSTLGSALGYIPEGAWNEPEVDDRFQASAGGGGVSAFIATPYWQAGTGVPGNAGRYTPDVALAASAREGYFGCMAAAGADCLGNDFAYFYGTAASSAGMAGIVALLDHAEGVQGNLNPALYALAAQPSLAVFHDATPSSAAVTCDVDTPSVCNNSTPAGGSLAGGVAGYALNAGYDQATGWGSVDAANLLAHWSAGVPSSTSMTLSGTPGLSFNSGTPVTITAHVASARGTPPGTVRFVSNGTLLGSLALSAGAATLHQSTAGLPPGAYTVQVSYSGAVGYTPSTASITGQIYAPTTTALATSAASVAAGGSVKFTATVTSAFGSPPGSVNFYSGKICIGSANMPNGTAVLLVNSAGVPAGNYSVNAVYVPSGLYDASTSNTVQETVTP